MTTRLLTITQFDHAKAAAFAERMLDVLSSSALAPYFYTVSCMHYMTGAVDRKCSPIIQKVGSQRRKTPL
ncbi:MAG TPA: hypothetical protein V6C65_05315, partial [Allocoleopsis sp.]